MFKMKRNTDVKPNRLLILGRGVDKKPEFMRPSDGRQPYDEQQYELSPASEMRAATAAIYYRVNKKLFETQGARIVVSGGYAGLAGNQKAPPRQSREATLIIDHMMKEYDVPSHILELENESTSTTDNYAKVLKFGYFAGEEFNNENPLLTVGSRQHVVRRGLPLGRAAFGITEERGALCLLAENESLLTRAKEVVGGVATGRAITDVDPQPWSASDMDLVGLRFKNIIENRAEVVKSIPDYALHAPYDGARGLLLDAA